MTDVTIGVEGRAYGRRTMIVLAVLIAFVIAVAYALYALRPSGIAQHPYGKIYGGAPGAFGPGSVSGRDERERVPWSRGTR